MDAKRQEKRWKAERRGEPNPVSGFGLGLAARTCRRVGWRGGWVAWAATVSARAATEAPPVAAPLEVGWLRWAAGLFLVCFLLGALVRMWYLKQKVEEALDNVKTLSGLLPICAACKRIRDDQGYWSRLESYIQSHSEVKFSHGICPECMQALYPEIVKEREKGRTAADTPPGPPVSAGGPAEAPSGERREALGRRGE